eukprot:gnl/MRDRNA2_/MRDRNA2_100795_c0_seq1.p1 gnl/MRDRNA2_/MRDRNA2_100795_c0~~gnl/MRDRNA2_/MRDRNA2_100795_c0_seq1.p1  ORF type:complete len:799 (-),score=176.33 gnl/MRDRNA2_/MRDRNA2_100795_c0_seq1:117-2378(-)
MAPDDDSISQSPRPMPSPMISVGTLGDSGSSMPVSPPATVAASPPQGLPPVIVTDQAEPPKKPSPMISVGGVPAEMPKSPQRSPQYDDDDDYGTTESLGLGGMPRTERPKKKTITKVDDDDDENETKQAPPSRPRLARSFTLTVKDQNQSREAIIANHDRSQKIFRTILSHRGIKPPKGASPQDFVARSVSPVAPDADSRGKERRALAHKILGKLKERGIHGIRTFRVMCHNMDFHHDGVCLGRALEGALAHMGIKLKTAEYQHLSDLFGVDEQPECIDYICLLQCICENISEQRLEVVEEAYQFLCETCPGSKLTVFALESRFKPAALNANLVPDLLEHHSIQEFLSQWGAGVLGADGVVTWNDFLDYYLDVSMSVDSDVAFCEYVCNMWGIHMDDLVAKKIFRRYATGEDQDSLQADDFLLMLRELDGNLSDEEALAWLETIDEDGSGEISLAEFLQSKVLRVKRLFDRYDTDGSRSLDKKELMNILRELDDSISEAEANALYDCIDIDGNGEVSFCEFLESNILKLHDIFFEFDSDHSREFSETELKSLLRQLDPFLSDFDLHLIYKAIDTDGSGRVSFVEFVESHVLKAKTLFDRYDVDRSRALTEPEFKELLLDLDEDLSDRELEAIYSLVSDEETGKVNLGDFLNPNVLKIKLLFDKYDTDKSRTLSPQEFKKMLKELYRTATDKDADILHRVLCPITDDNYDVSFVDYFRRFKEVARRRDLMELEKRRAARAKAKARGLQYRGIRN